MGWLSNAAIRESKLLKKILKLVSYIIDGDGNVTGFVDADGNVVTGLTSYTWTQFTGGSFDLTVARYVHVSDKHSTQDATSAPGSLWWIDPSAASARKRQLVSGPLYHATLAACPDPSAWPSLEVFPANIVSPLRSDGTVYRPIHPYILLVNNLSALTRAKGSSPDITTEWQPSPIRLYRDVNNKSIWRDGDYIEIRHAWCEKTGTTDTPTQKIRIGTSNAITDTEILSITTTAGNYVRAIRLMEIARVDSTHVKIRGASSSTFNQGPLALAGASSVTVSDMDSTSDSYFNIGMYNSGLSDTALILREYEVRLVKGY